MILSLMVSEICTAGFFTLIKSSKLVCPSLLFSPLCLLLSLFISLSMIGIGIKSEASIFLAWVLMSSICGYFLLTGKNRDLNEFHPPLLIYLLHCSSLILSLRILIYCYMFVQAKFIF